MHPQRKPFSVKVGNRLRFHMREAGLTTADCAEALDLGVFRVQQHMRGDGMPDLQQLRVYAALFNVPTDALVPPVEDADIEWPPRDSNSQPTDVWFDLAGAR